MNVHGKSTRLSLNSVQEQNKSMKLLKHSGRRGVSSLCCPSAPLTTAVETYLASSSTFFLQQGLPDIVFWVFPSKIYNLLWWVAPFDEGDQCFQRKVTRYRREKAGKAQHCWCYSYTLYQLLLRFFCLIAKTCIENLGTFANILFLCFKKIADFFVQV